MGQRKRLRRRVEGRSPRRPRCAGASALCKLVRIGWIVILHATIHARVGARSNTHAHAASRRQAGTHACKVSPTRAPDAPPSPSRIVSRSSLQACTDGPTEMSTTGSGATASRMATVLSAYPPEASFISDAAFPFSPHGPTGPSDYRCPIWFSLKVHDALLVRGYDPVFLCSIRAYKLALYYMKNSSFQESSATPTVGCTKGSIGTAHRTVAVRQHINAAAWSRSY